MNICGNGVCVCYDYEYPDSGCEAMHLTAQPDPDYDPRYYWSTERGVVLSVNNPREMVLGINYYLSPDEAARAARDQTVREALGHGLLTPEQAAELAGLSPVGHEKRHPAKSGPPLGHRSRVQPKRQFPSGKDKRSQKP